MSKSMDEMFDGVFDNLFSAQDKLIFSNVYPSGADIEELRKHGKVTISKKKENDMIIETLVFDSFDNSTSFTKINSYFEVDEKEEQIKKVSELLDLAVKNEDYVKAAELKKEKDNLLNNN